MNVFVFEYATALNSHAFIAEGKVMLNLITGGLKNEGIESCTISNIKPNQLYKKILENVSNSDNTILIAPNYELLKISRFLKEHNVFEKVLISPLDALEKTLNKFNLYTNLDNELKNVSIPLPKTIKFSDFHADSINFPLIIKPIYGTGCENTYFFKTSESYNAFIQTGEQKFNENFIVQEFIDGIHTSVCLFAGKKIEPVSLNGQYIDFNINFGQGKIYYKGGVVPFYGNEYIKDIKSIQEQIFEHSKSVCAHLNLRGYIGMDFVIDWKNKKNYLIEINPRITTSAVALSKAANLNIAKLHIACFRDEGEEILRKELSRVKFSNVVEILKYKNGIKCRTKIKN